MIAIVHSIYSQSVHAPALNAGLIDNDAERYCTWLTSSGACLIWLGTLCKTLSQSFHDYTISIGFVTASCITTYGTSRTKLHQQNIWEILGLFTLASLFSYAFYIAI